MVTVQFNEIDLTKFELTKPSGFPYFHLKKTTSDFIIFDGDPRIDKYLIYQVPMKSDTGKIISKCNRKATEISKKGRSTELFDAIFKIEDDILNACQLGPSNKIEGKEAWLMYWNEFSEADKYFADITTVHHIEAMKERYNLLISEKRKLSNDPHIIAVLDEKFRRETEQELLKYLVPASTPQITLSHAIEFRDFYLWLNKKDSSRQSKTEILTFEEASISGMSDKMLQILRSKRVIDEENTLIGDDTLLYSLIKRFNREGYFNKITLTKLHLIVNKKFKAKATYQLLKQVPVYNKDLN